MDILTIYICIAAGVAVIFWLRRLLYRFLFHRALQPYLIQRWCFFEPITRWRAVLWVVHWATTLICNFIGVKDRQEVSSRAGTLAMLHFVPLFFTRQFSFAADQLGISLAAHRHLHQALGIMAVLQAALHVSVVLWDKVMEFSDRVLRFGFVDAPDGTAATVSVIVRVQSGLSMALALTPHRRLRAIVDGPYGGARQREHWDEMKFHDSVMLFATDIGVAGQLPYVRDLLRIFISAGKSMVDRGGGLRRYRITLLWEISEEFSANSVVRDEVRRVALLNTERLQFQELEFQPTTVVDSF
ncbi:hypothetical protein I7I51_02685 [Histoplasma capsulatum]|uniref:Uncharacterized protein n=1 Tax=Ajellomyces capsulatus TaxID=5037 RepID=A0A8A1MEK4_AJECA|nr:hypothetical protein I7I51_02685 [Histoplasma capsulatum]